jgi:hypothetical protein
MVGAQGHDGVTRTEYFRTEYEALQRAHQLLEDGDHHAALEEVEFAMDSPLEGGGFEPSVPVRDNVFRACARSTSDAARGTDGSNPAPSSGESVSRPQPPS